MRQRADREVVHAGTRDLAGIGQRKPAAGLEPHLAAATAVRIVATGMLSSSKNRAPAASASRTCSTVSHSTSSGTHGAAARTAATAWATPPAAATRLS